MCVGEKINGYLIENGINPNLLSRLTKIRLTRLELILSGKKKLTLREYKRICLVLNVKIDRFLESKNMKDNTRKDLG